MRMTIGTRLALGFGSIITLMVISSVVAFTGQTRMGESNDQVLETAVPVVHACSELLGSVNHSVAAARGIIIAGADADDTEIRRESFKESWSDIDSCLARLGQYTDIGITGVDGATLSRVRATIAELRNIQQGALKKIGDAENWATHGRDFENDLVPRVRSLRDDLDRMQEAAGDALKQARSELHTASAAVQRTLLGSTALAVVLAAVIAVRFSRSMARSLQAVVVQAQAIARGDLRGDALRVTSRDEIYDLAQAFDAMKVGLRELAGQMREATENVNTSAAEIVASTQQQAAAIKEQAAALQQITSTMQEIDESGAQIEQSARQVSTDAEAASAASSEGSSAAQSANRTMEGIREQVEQVAENIVNLSDRTQTIGEIIATVTDLAEQSNLLALNASIEAVSAGEQGSRFSVVASEMKNLAEQAKACTVQVRTILGEIQKGIHASVMLTEESVKRVEQGKQQAEVTESTIRQMSDTTLRCVQAFEQIAGGSSQQQIGVSQVAQGMKGIRQAVEQSAAGTAQLERAASSLGALSRQLHGVASRYQL